MKSISFFGLLFSMVLSLFAQEKRLPYYEIPEQPEKYTAGAVAARIVDGLGFRFYWATDGLRAEDLAYKPGKNTRTTAETLEHIYELSVIIVNAATKTVNSQVAVKPNLTFSELRERTLENLKAASDRLRISTDEDLKDYKLVFSREAKTTEYPFWNLLNGPIADCLWHVGQVVSFRRASGNPFSDKASVFTGKVRE